MKLREIEEAEKARRIQDDKRRKNKSIYFWRQILASVSSMIATIGVGITFSFTGAWNLKDRGLINDDEETVLITTNLFSMILGTCFSWFSIEMLGSQISMFLLSQIWVVGWFILSVSSDYYSILGGCIIVGFAAGFNNNIAIEYLVEMPEPKLRGAITVFSTACSFFGIFLGHLSGIAVETQPLGMQLCALVPILTMLFTYWSPPSPYWLLKNNQLEKAKHNFFRLRGKTRETEEEFDEILNRQSDIEPETKCSSLKKLSRGFLRPFCISVLIFSCTCGSGSDVLILYAKRVLKQLSTQWNPNMVTLLVDAICIVCCTLSCYFIKIITRRSLFLCSCIAEILSLLAIISAQIYSLSNEFLTVVLCIYMAINSFGLNSIAWLVPAEIFPEGNRHMGIGASTIYYFLLTMALGTLIPKESDVDEEVTAKLVPVLWMFVGVMSICTFLLFFVMPETKDVTLEEVEDQMAHEKLISFKWGRKKKTIK